MSVPSVLPEELIKKRAGVFVSLHRKKDGSLRGCVGTFLATSKNIAAEIIENALKAAFSDPRFTPLAVEELANLEISVDVLEKPETIGKNLDSKGILKIEGKLDPKKYGIIVSTPDRKHGLLLPDIDGVDTAEKQIQICRAKAGIGEDEAVNIERFEVKRYKE